MQHHNWKLGLLLSLSTALMWGVLPVSIAPIIGPVDPVTITYYRLGGGGATQPCGAVVVALLLTRRASFFFFSRREDEGRW